MVVICITTNVQTILIVSQGRHRSQVVHRHRLGLGDGFLTGEETGGSIWDSSLPIAMAPVET